MLSSLLTCRRASIVGHGPTPYGTSLPTTTHQFSRHGIIIGKRGQGGGGSGGFPPRDQRRFRRVSGAAGAGRVSAHRDRALAAAALPARGRPRRAAARRCV